VTSTAGVISSVATSPTNSPGATGAMLRANGSAATAAFFRLGISVGSASNTFLAGATAVVGGRILNADNNPYQLEITANANNLVGSNQTGPAALFSGTNSYLVGRRGDQDSAHVGDISAGVLTLTIDADQRDLIAGNMRTFFGVT
jgi:hypothetical protein